MGTCCGYVNQKQDRDKTVYTGGSQGNREREIQDVLDKLNDENQNETRLHPQDKIDDQGETSSQRSFLYGSMLQNNIHSMIQNHGTMEQDENNEKYKKEPFYGAEALGEYQTAQTVDINLQNIANEEISPVQADQINLEVKEQKKLMLSNSKEIKELEKKKSDLLVIKQDTLQALNPKDKDILRRASQQFEQQQSLLKQQQQQLVQQQQLLEKQQFIQQQMQQQILAQQQQLQIVQQTKQPPNQQNVAQNQQQSNSANTAQNTVSSQVTSTQQNNTERISVNGQKQPINLPPLKKPNSQATSSSQPNSPLLSAKGKKAENDVNSSFDSGSVKSVDKPRSIMKRRNQNDLNSSFNSDADSQKSKAKKKVKFKESAFKKTSKKKKGY